MLFLCLEAKSLFFCCLSALLSPIYNRTSAPRSIKELKIINLQMTILKNFYILNRYLRKKFQKKSIELK